MTAIVEPGGCSHRVYMINGVRVEFPAKAYPSQIAMMEKVIKGLQRNHNCLLESPTGSGKTLALLCASLAWQKAEKAKQIGAQADFGSQSLENFAEWEHYTRGIGSKILLKMGYQPGKGLGKNLQGRIQPVESQFLVEGKGLGYGSVNGFVPKIFFGTRTHKQINQMVKEFRRTAYCKTRMTVLGSREHTCIHPEVSRSFNKSEGCQQLNDMLSESNPGCQYRTRGIEMLSKHVYGYDNGWDIEDLVGLGRKLQRCPYYASRDLMEQAEIIFVPYNYLIDPAVRKRMKIPLEDNIIILDEAHNIEDSARAAASGTFLQEDFRLALIDCEKVNWMAKFLQNFNGDLFQAQWFVQLVLQIPATDRKSRDRLHQIGKLAKFSSFMMNFMDNTGKSVFDDETIMTGKELVEKFTVENYGPNILAEISFVVEVIFNEQNGGRSSSGTSPIKVEEGVEKVEADSKLIDTKLHLLAKTRATLEDFLMIVNLMMDNEQTHLDDYQVAIARSKKRNMKIEASNGFNSQSQWTYALKLWCLNPAIVLKQVRESTRSIVVTSGTLSPLDSYASELGIDFMITLEANHVIPTNRVWIASISQGPKNTILNGSYKTTSSFEYQDELGRVMLSVCQTIPHGVLCFLPSYSLLEKFVARWQDTGLWQQLSTVKTLVCESRDSYAFEETLKDFYSAIEDSQRSLNSSLNSSGEEIIDGCQNKRKEGTPSGALMLAVCRGKVSEGLDFTDNNARAVVCVGIPFPYVKDKQVELKRKYNDKKSTCSALLKGSEWYEIQAFRALNQALGRCIRHKGDWGAILLVDDRFAKKPRYVKQLSKWVRASIRHYDKFSPMLHYLSQFTNGLVKEDAAALLAVQQQALLQSPQESILSIRNISIASPPSSVRPKNALSTAIPEFVEDNSSTRSY